MLHVVFLEYDYSCEAAAPVWQLQGCCTWFAWTNWGSCKTQENRNMAGEDLRGPKFLYVPYD